MPIKMFSLIAFILVTVSCTSQTWEVSRPVRKTDLGKVAALQFSGPNSEVFEALVVSELLKAGVTVIERTRLLSILIENNLSISDITEGRKSSTIVKKLAGVDTLIYGSIVPIVVYVSGGISGKVSAASIRFVDSQTGAIITTSTFGTDSDLLAPAPTYSQVAKRLIGQLFR